MIGTIIVWAQMHHVILGAICTLVIANLTTWLTKYPASQPATIGLEVFKYLQNILDGLSIKPHTDAAAHLTLGSTRWKPMFVRSRKPTGLELPTTIAPQAAILIPLLIALTATVAMAGCSWCVFNSSCKTGTASFCVSQEVTSQSPHLLPIIAELVALGVGDLKDELANLALTIGKDGLDILKCIMQDYFGQTGTFLATINSGKTAVTTVKWLAMPVSAIQRGHQRAGEWLKANGVAVTQ